MSAIALRTCMRETKCSACDRDIGRGEKYWSSPYKSLCVECYDKDKAEKVAEKKAMDETHVITGNCEYCTEPAVGILWGKKICSVHIQDAITEFT